MFDRLPAKTAIFCFALMAASLSLSGYLARGGVERAVGGLEEAALPGPGPALTKRPTLTEEIELSGLADIPEVAALLSAEQGTHPGDPLEPAPGTDEPRPKDWVYPAFDTPAQGLHGPPLAATPRSVRVRFVDESGRSLDPLTVHSIQSNPDDGIAVEAFRATEDGATWTVGSPSITAGEEVIFAFTASVNGLPNVGELVISEVAHAPASAPEHCVVLRPQPR